MGGGAGFITLIPFPMFFTTTQHECFKFPQTASHISEWLLRRCSVSKRAWETWDLKNLEKMECLKQMGLFSTVIYIPYEYIHTHIYICYLFICLPQGVASLDLPLAAPETHSLLIGINIAPQSCHHSLFLLWWRPGRISSTAFEVHAVESQTEKLHRAYTTSSQAVLSQTLPFHHTTLLRQK